MPSFPHMQAQRANALWLGFYIVPVYINTKANDLADDLSRNKLQSFLSKVPQADHAQTPISLQLLALLLDQQADWTSPTWRPFNGIFAAD